MMIVFAVLFFAAGPPRPAGSRGNDDTREEAAGKTQRVSSGACQIRRGIDRQSGNGSSRRAGFPGAASVRQGRKASFSRVGI